MSSRALRKQQNDEALLEALLDSSTAKQKSKKTASKPVGNIFALMDQTEDDEEVLEEDNEAEADDNEPIEEEIGKEEIADSPKIQLQSKKSRKKKNKKNKKNKTLQKDTATDDASDEEELDKIIKQFQKEDIKKFGLARAYNSDEEDFMTASENEFEDEEEKYREFYDRIENSLQESCSFEKFNIKNLIGCSKFFNNDLRKLDPHTEYKLLFDDISAKSLDDIDSVSSTSISPQQLKQIQRLKRLVRNWGGKDRRTVPNGPGGAAHRLVLTKIRDDWIPSQRGEFKMNLLTKKEIVDWHLWIRPSDWKEVVEEDVDKMSKHVNFYKFDALNPDLMKKEMTEFYVSVILHPDHEALINLISSRYPYMVPGLLQVALITIRQGDRSNTNGLLQRAVFVFDRALKANIRFDSLKCQLPYIYFFNRQFYLTIFRYIQALGQRGAVGTASEWCKLLWSLSPLEDPLGCRYFIDHYLLLNEEHQYIIELSKSSLVNTYREWYTLGFGLAVTLSYFKLGELEKARKELFKCVKNNLGSSALLFTEKLRGSIPQMDGDLIKSESDILEYRAYATRFLLLWKSSDEINFLHDELNKIFSTYKKETFSNDLDNLSVEGESLFFIDRLPINLLRFAILSEESSLMGAIPERIWSEHEFYEFDVLPPQSTSRETDDTIETIKSFINESEMVNSQMQVLQDQDILQRIQQLSLEQYLNENEGGNFDTE
ncbi:hypothetical protein RNJ44_04661 [Nakaseomyces bracarensis]|uniref:Ribosome quality control complex subunit 1 n=1 Tax=Nakaseomyces bracarensis TaxID=273131 RepID=A0ABR4NVL0_9SACH